MIDSQIKKHCWTGLFAGLILLIASGFCGAEEVGAIHPSMNEKVVMLRVGEGFRSVQLETTLFIPRDKDRIPWSSSTMAKH